MRELTHDDFEDAEADRQARNALTCRCQGDMPGYCPGPASCPMCISNAAEDVAREQALIDADLILNRNKIERADASALHNQIMLQVMLREVA